MGKQNDIRGAVQDANLHAADKVGPKKVVFVLYEERGKPVQIHVRTDGKMGTTADPLELARRIESASVGTLTLSKANFNSGVATIEVACMRFNYETSLKSGRIRAALLQFVDGLVDGTYLDPH